MNSPNSPMYSPTADHHYSPNPISSGSSTLKKSSMVHVCKLKRLNTGMYKVASVPGSHKKHKIFLDSLFHNLVNINRYETRGVSREELNSIIDYISPDGPYRTYYSYIISITIKPKKLF